MAVTVFLLATELISAGFMIWASIELCGVALATKRRGFWKTAICEGCFVCATIAGRGVLMGKFFALEHGSSIRVEALLVCAWWAVDVVFFVLYLGITAHAKSLGAGQTKEKIGDSSPNAGTDAMFFFLYRCAKSHSGSEEEEEEKKKD